MLEIVNNLEPFFEDCYRIVSVREYARLIKKSPPTASKLLKGFAQEGYLHKRPERGHLLFSLDQTNEEVTALCKMYWTGRLVTFTEELKKRTVGASAVLFGSLSKAEVKRDSDVDIAVFSPEKKTLDISPIEKRMGRKISIQWFTSLRGIKNEHLLNNILNGMILLGKVKW